MLQSSSGAHIDVLKDDGSAKWTALPPGFEADSRVIEISGPFEAKARAVYAVLEAIEKKPFDGPGLRDAQLLVKADMVGLILGKGGESVKEIRQVSGAGVIYVKKREAPEAGEEKSLGASAGLQERSIQVCGSLEGRVRAIR